MLIRNVATLVAASAFAFACTNESTPTATSPDLGLRFAKPVAGPCAAATDRTIKAQQMDLFAGAVLDQVQALWASVEAACSPTNADAANASLLAYVQYTISVYPDGVETPKTGSKESVFLGHWNTIFSFVGYPAPNLPTGVSGPLEDSGAVGVISPTGGAREITALNAALTLAEQSPSGDQRWHLFAIYPVGSACLTGTNLAQTGPCYEFAAFPTVSPKWDPLIKVGICQPLHDGESIPANVPALGHLEPSGSVEIAGQLLYPTYCEHIAAGNTGSWTGGFGAVMKRLAWLGKSAVGVNVAYATHGGLGGFGIDDSKFGAVDLMVFNATFSVPPNIIGQAPVAPEVGTFTQSVKAPGTILVQASLGQDTDTLAVLSQAGGNCSPKCGGLLLQGNLASASTSPADEGVYEASWTSVQDQPSVKGAPIIARDDLKREIARLSYATVSSANQLLYNGSVVGSWTRHVPQNFKIVVNLNTKTTSLSIDGVDIASATNVPFYNTSAANFAQIAADFSGIDSGIMGWDNVKVVRLSDH